MKNKYLKYTLLSIAITSSLLFTACGNKSETINEAPETTAVEETTEDVIVEEPVEESEKAMNPDYDNPEEYIAEDYYATEETIAEAEAAKAESEPDLTFNVDILDIEAEGYRKDLEEGRIDQETYDMLMQFVEESRELADENGNFSLNEVNEEMDKKVDQSNSSSSSSQNYEYNPNSYSAQHGIQGVEGADSFERDSLDGYHDPDFAGYRMN